MQVKFLTIITSILAASSVQATVPVVNAGDYTAIVTSLNNIATNTNSLTTTVNKLKTSNVLTTGFTVLGDLTKLVLSLGSGTTSLSNTPAPVSVQSIANSQLVCTAVKTVTDALAGLLTALNNKLSTLAGSLLAVPLSIVVGLLEKAIDALQTQLTISTPACSSSTDSGFDVLQTLLDTLTLTKP
ncbi:hypothetical protein BGZ61DRAFT_445812 [Ilyonectria robusta]|uniref:uncharacterized protein n=1 Tax=Ilyonectria robusta TaxID=1079257 RepID=UPI001E8ED511|nr:uncharacterized protein BGZ61DRAFT_445812 [Ilyonectria robusta]KAH8734102.1 hypothetical protein BGZ61DRAFT_445812 [Ilyonectria robusta]